MCLAVPTRVIELLPDGMAKVSLDGVVKDISVALVEGVAVGDYVVVHVGYALARIDPAELLVNEPTSTRLWQVSVNPTAGAGGCPVETAEGCVAMRRATCCSTTCSSSRFISSFPLS